MTYLFQVLFAANVLDYRDKSNEEDFSFYNLIFSGLLLLALMGMS